MASTSTTSRPGCFVPTALGFFALALAAAAGVLAYGMLVPVRWDLFGKYAAIALAYPFHLVAVTVLTVLLALVAKRFRAEVAKGLFLFTAILAAGMAAGPAIGMWRTASVSEVSLSVREYVDNAAHWNLGEPRTDRTRAYGTAADGTELVLDVWDTGLPKAGPARPAVVFVHGGDWTHGHRSETPDWDRWLNELGFEVFDVEYRLAPPERFKDAVGDVKAALGWVAGHAAEFHVDPGLISVMGNSAGAHLAMLAAYAVNDPELPPSTSVPPVRPRCVVNLYGPTELKLLHGASPSPAYVREALEAYLGGGPDVVPERYALLSPLAHVSSDSPPTITFIGTSDRIVTTDHSELLDRRLETAKVPHESYWLPFNDHDFDLNWGGLGTQIARAKIRDFLVRYGARRPVEAPPQEGK